MTRMLGMLFGCVIAAGLLAVGLSLAPGVEVPGDETAARAAVAPAALAPGLAPAAIVTAPALPVPPVDEAGGPEVDILRVERDGATLVSGRATPGTEVEILVGAGKAGEAPVDAQGNFVAYLTLPESDLPQSLNLRERDAEGKARAGKQSFVVETRRPALEALVRDATAGDDREAPAAVSEDQAAAVLTALAVPDGVLTEPAPAIGQAADPRVSLPGEVGIRKPAAPPLASATGRPGRAPAPAGQDSGASDRPDAPDPSLEMTAAPELPNREETPVSTVRPNPPQPAAALPKPTEAGVPPVVPPLQVALPHDAPAPVAARGESPAARTSPPAVVEAPAQPEAPRVLRVENGSLSVLQDGAPRPELSIDTIRYTPAGNVVLGGRAPQTASVRAYLDDRPLDAVRSGADGQWRLDLPALEERTYSLRVDQLGGEGEVVARAETPFRPESAESLDVLRGMVEDGVRRVTVQPGFTLWAIAERNYGDGLSFVRLFEANEDKIRNPDLIYPGQVFAVPD